MLILWSEEKFAVRHVHRLLRVDFICGAKLGSSEGRAGPLGIFRTFLQMVSEAEALIELVLQLQRLELLGLNVRFSRVTV